MTIVKQVKFEGAWDKFKAAKCFQREAQTKYVRQTLNFM